MDVDLREALTQGFGPEPAHRPLTDRLEAGHRAVRRRTLAGTAAVVVLATAMGMGATTLANGGEQPEFADSSRESSDPNLPEADLWGGELARYSAEGVVVLRPGVTVLHRIGEPLGDDSGSRRSVALAVEWRGSQRWLLLTWESAPDGSTSTSEAGTPADGSFADWVEQQVAATEDNSAGYVEFGRDGRLVSTHGVEILDQVLDPGFEGFVMPGEPSAAALLQGPDGKKWYVAVRDSGGLEVIAVPFETGGATLDDFIKYARQKYASGEGLR